MVLRQDGVDDVDEARLIEKLLAVEALHAGAATKGERDAAENARRRILERLAELMAQDPPIEYRFSMTDMWSRKVFVALLRRYGITPFRYKGQRHTTVMAKVPRSFVDETLWPEFQELSDTLKSYLSEVTDRVVSQVIHADSSEASVVMQPPQLTLAASGESRLGEDGVAAASTTGARRGVDSEAAAVSAQGVSRDNKATTTKNRRKRQSRKKRKR